MDDARMTARGPRVLSHRGAAGGLAALALLQSPPPAAAIERLSLEAETLQLPGIGTARGVAAVLELARGGRSRAALRAASARLAAGPGFAPLERLALVCGELVVREPRFACADAQLRLTAPQLGPLNARLDLSADSDRGRARLRVADLEFAGGRIDGRLQADAAGWQLEAGARALDAGRLRALLPASLLPPDIEAQGRLAGELHASGRGASWSSASLDLDVAALALQNAAGTIATEDVGAALRATLAPEGEAVRFALHLGHTRGQALAGPVLLDLGAQPLTLEVAGRASAAALEVERAQWSQPGLLEASGSARVALGPAPRLEAASLDVARLEFPAAYTSFLQLALAATELGSLQSSGHASAHLEWRDGAPRALEATLAGLAFDDPPRRLALRGLDGRLQWDAAGGPERLSGLAWQSLELYGIEGGPGALALRAHGRDFALLQPARIPVFDGALVLQTLELGAVGTPALRLAFAADIEPISMTALSGAFHWPAMAGRVSGHIPELVFRGRTLEFGGDLTATVFDGTVTARRLRLVDPLGSFPRVTGDFEARRLDLDLITHTFPIGSITGRLDADVGGLELFGWSPVAFDAHLYTSPGDRSRHRISQRAVNSLSNLGGGGGVMGALQSGFLQFFKTFGYDRIGLTCQLRDDVCLMNGIPRREGGFYIVRGGGLPRIDVVANSGRVAWSQLLGQVQSAIAGGNISVR